MGKKIDPFVVQREAKALCDLLSDRGIVNFAAFAASLDPKRLRGELHQHMKGMRPIPLSAARAYAKELKCEIRDFSPRWADELGINKWQPFTAIDELETELLNAFRKLDRAEQLDTVVDVESRARRSELVSKYGTEIPDKSIKARKSG